MSTNDGATHYSGIVVLCKPDRFSYCIEALQSLPGVDVHYSDPPSGRIVIVQETRSAEAQKEGLERIHTLPGVRLAALVEHRIDPDMPSLEATRKGDSQR